MVKFRRLAGLIVLGTIPASAALAAGDLTAEQLIGLAPVLESGDARYRSIEASHWFSSAGLSRRLLASYQRQIDMPSSWTMRTAPPSSSPPAARTSGMIPSAG